MLNRSCLFIFCILFCMSVSSQKKWGLEAGINISSVTGYQGLGITTGSLHSFQSSFFAMLPIRKNFYLNPSVGYLPKGILFKKVNVADVEGNDLGNATLSKRFNYLQFSFPLAYKLPMGTKSFGFAEAGPYVAYALSGKTGVSDFIPFVTGTPTPGSESINFKAANINRLDAGITVRFRFISSHKWCAGANFDFGLSKISSLRNSIVDHNQDFGFTVGYVF